jgi:acid stress-induced BolA-like protein IbaG/YrbA
MQYYFDGDFSMIDKHNAIRALHPEAVLIRGDEAFDVDGNPVTYDETAVQAYIDAHAYIAKRQAEYPPMTDWIDGVVKGDQAQIDKYIADCQAVKAKYPK